MGAWYKTSANNIKLGVHAAIAPSKNACRCSMIFGLRPADFYREISAVL